MVPTSYCRIAYLILQTSNNSRVVTITVFSKINVSINDCPNLGNITEHFGPESVFQVHHQPRSMNPK